MVVRRAVRCTECGQPYVARVVGDQVVLSTADGNCACGNDALTVVGDTLEVGT